MLIFKNFIDNESSNMLILIFHRGLLNDLRLVFGVKYAPEMFIRKLENILKKIEYVVAFLHGVIIRAKNK